MDETAEALLDGIAALHREVDALGVELIGRLPHPLACRPGCSLCCPPDLTVLEIEAEWIRRAVGDRWRAEEPARSGCAFLDEAGSCRIYPYRPYVCRTQGLPLRWYEEDERGEIIESRDICEKSAGAFELEELAEDGLWLLGPCEARLVELAEAWGQGAVRRRGLGDLFRELTARPYEVLAGK
jgi:uncharacterized protein